MADKLKTGFPYKINERQILSENNLCSTNCVLNYKYPSSTNYKVCDSSSNFLDLPCLKITNQTLSTSEIKNIIFNETEYWFHSIYITKPDNYLFKYINNKTPVDDPSMCNFIILNKDRMGNYLLIIQRIKAGDTSNSNGEIITDIIDGFIAGESESYKCNIDTGFPLESKFVELENFIPHAIYFYFNTLTSYNNNIDFIVYSGTQSIITNHDTIDKLNSTILIDYVNVPIMGEQLITALGTTVYISKNAPINNLKDDTSNDIYIDCQPTNEEGELLETGISKIDQPIDLGLFGDLTGIDIGENVATSTILGIVLMIAILKGGEFLFRSGSKFLLEKL